MVDQAVRRWAEKVAQQRQDVVRIGYFGSYARGDWGVGSDLDLVIVMERSDQPFEKRGAEWDVAELPVPADVLIYTKEEWQSLGRRRRFYQTVMREAVWVYIKGSRHVGEALKEKSATNPSTSSGQVSRINTKKNESGWEIELLNAGKCAPFVQRSGGAGEQRR